MNATAMKNSLTRSGAGLVASVGAAAGLALYAFPSSEPRLVRAKSGVPPPVEFADMHVGQTMGGAAVLAPPAKMMAELDSASRRPSWATKFQAPEMSEADAKQLKADLDAGAASRLRPRPSWEGKFQGPQMDEVEVKQLKTELDAGAASRLQRRPSWASKFEHTELDAKALEALITPQIAFSGEADGEVEALWYSM